MRERRFATPGRVGKRARTAKRCPVWSLRWSNIYISASPPWGRPGCEDIVRGFPSTVFLCCSFSQQQFFSAAVSLSNSSSLLSIAAVLPAACIPLPSTPVPPSFPSPTGPNATFYPHRPVFSEPRLPPASESASQPASQLASQLARRIFGSILNPF